MDIPVLDLFILTMLDRGVATPYDLQHQAGLSQGATIPALRRLVAGGLVRRREDEGVTRRPRHHYTLTPKGCKLVQTKTQAGQIKEETLVDLDSVLRLADIGLHYRAMPDSISDLLVTAARQRDDMAAKLRTDSVQRAGRPQTYSEFRKICDGARLTAEASALRSLSRQLLGRKHSSRTRRRVGMSKSGS